MKDYNLTELLEFYNSAIKNADRDAAFLYWKQHQELANRFDQCQKTLRKAAFNNWDAYNNAAFQQMLKQYGYPYVYISR